MATTYMCNKSIDTILNSVCHLYTRVGMLGERVSLQNLYKAAIVSRVQPCMLVLAYDDWYLLDTTHCTADTAQPSLS